MAERSADRALAQPVTDSRSRDVRELRDVGTQHGVVVRDASLAVRARLTTDVDPRFTAPSMMMCDATVTVRRRTIVGREVRGRKELEADDPHHERHCRSEADVSTTKGGLWSHAREAYYEQGLVAS